MNIYLLIHNIGSIVSAILATGAAVFVFLNDRTSKANTFFALLLMSAVVFISAHVIGVNIADPYLSRDVLMFNLSLFFIACFLLHTVLVVTGKERSHRWLLILSYGTGTALVIWFILHPEYFLLPSVPKLYFPNYYNPGILNWVRIIFLYVIILPYSLYLLAISYRKSTLPAERNRFLFFFVSLAVGFGIAYIPNFLVYNISIDPIWGVWFFLFSLFPLVYAIIKYELFDIKIVAKQAFVYSISIAIVGGLVIMLDYTNQYIHAAYPSFQTWVIPLISAVILVSISFIIWRRLRESDLLKYEFITVVTHKFRTPLTQIRWAVETIAPTVPASEQEFMNQIKTANFRLIELTNLLVRLSDTDSVDHEYVSSVFSFNQTIQSILPEYVERARVKDILFTYDEGIDTAASVTGDETKLKFVIQILFDNAINYNYKGGSVHVTLSKDTYTKAFILSVKDTGIGLSKEEQGRLFQKFWRSSSALKADTEGMGIGLFLANHIVERQDGKLWAESNGLEKGSTFFLKLPIT